MKINRCHWSSKEFRPALIISEDVCFWMAVAEWRESENIYVPETHREEAAFMFFFYPISAAIAIYMNIATGGINWKNISHICLRIFGPNCR